MNFNTDVSADDKEPDVPDFWEDVEKVEILHKRVGVSISVFTDDEGNLREEYEDLLGDVDLENINGVDFEKGEELPLEIAATVWSAFNDRLAAYDEDGDRLDNVSDNERRGFSTTAYTRA